MMPFLEDDAERYEALKNAITNSYATGAAPARRRNRSHRKRLAWLAAGGCFVVAILAGVMIAEWRAAIQVRDSAQSGNAAIVAQYTIPPYTPPPNPPSKHKSAEHTPAPQTPAPTATPPPKATPAPAEKPTATPSAAPTSSPSASASASPTPSAVAVIHNAFLLVHSNGLLKVGAKGSCGGLDVTVEVRGYPKGCTVFDADSTGPLANGRGAALVVPVSTTEDVQDVKYGLLYIRSSETDVPRFVGLVRSHGAGRVVVRLQHGVVMEQSGSDVRYFTFNGHGIVRTTGYGPEN